MIDNILVTTELGKQGYYCPGLILPPSGKISTFSQLFQEGDGLLHRIEIKSGLGIYQYWFTDGQAILRSSSTPQDIILNHYGYVCRKYGRSPIFFLIESFEEYLVSTFTH